MNIEYLLSFKDYDELLKLDDEFIKSLPDNFLKTYSKKVKKKIVKPISKNNILKNTKLQTAKNKDENKVKLILNKLSQDNFDNIIQEFLEIFTEINQENYNIILKVMYEKIVNDEKFIYIFFKFYNLINNIYSSIYDLNNKYFIDMIQAKTLYDYNNEKLDENMIFLEKINMEENRINNLKLIILLVESKNFSIEILSTVTDVLVSSNYIPDIVFWFSNNYINNNIKKHDYNNLLLEKLNKDINNRYVILLKNLLGINDNFNNTINETITEDEYQIEIKEEKIKSDFEVETDNIIEEFILLEDFEEIIQFFDTFKTEVKNVKIFMTTLLNFYFNNTLSNYSKFQKLFINLKKNKLIEIDIFKSSLYDVLNNENKFDYNNIDIKLEKLLDIYKIIQIKLSKSFISTIL